MKNKNFRVTFLSTKEQFEDVAETGDYPGNPARIPVTDFNILVIPHQPYGENTTAGGRK